MNDETQIESVTSEAGHRRVDEIEAAMLLMPPREFPVKHHFTPGLYCREIFMPAMSLLTSKIHREEHPYVVQQGEVVVWSEDQGFHRVRAPHLGITKAGTRRVLITISDTVWTTFHLNPENLRDIDEIESRIYVPRALAQTVDMSEILDAIQMLAREGRAAR